jgi:uncharacterized protein (TIGR02996 family)
MKLEQGFLADIAEHADDDGPRLVFADWLDDHGEHERAEFIRTQVELAKLDPYDDRAPDLLRRDRELRLQHGRVWAKPGLKFTRTAEFRRGFVGKMTMQASKFLVEAERIFAACPVQELRLMGFREEMDAFVRLECLGRLRALDVSAVRLGAGRVTTLVGSPHLSRLEKLNLGNTHMRLSGARMVIDSPNLPGVKTLHLDRNGIGDISVHYLAQSAALPSLQTLDLQASGLSAEGGERLGRLEHLGQQLEALDLRDNQLGDAGVRGLLAPGNFTRLRSLNLASNGLSLAAMATIAACPELTSLTELRVGREHHSTIRMRELAESPYLTNLRVLDASHGSMQDGAEALALSRAAFLPRLRALHLPRFSADGLRILFRTPALAGLHHLELSTDSQQGARLCADLRGAGQLSRLTHLDLRFCRVGRAGVEHLARAPHLAGLICLDLAWNDLGDESYRALIESPHLSRWCRVGLWGNRPPSEATRQALEDRFAEVVLSR